MSENYVCESCFLCVATITKMSNPTASGASNITGTLARPLVTATSTVAIVPGTMTTASLVQSSQSKVVGASVTRMPASAVAHRIAGAISGTSSNIGSAAGGSASLNLVTVHNQVSLLSLPPLLLLDVAWCPCPFH